MVSEVSTIARRDVALTQFWRTRRATNMVHLSPVDIILIIIPIALAILVTCLVTFRILRREYYWGVILLAAIAIFALLLTA